MMVLCPQMNEGEADQDDRQAASTSGRGGEIGIGSIERRGGGGKIIRSKNYGRDHSSHPYKQSTIIQQACGLSLGLPRLSGDGRSMQGSPTPSVESNSNVEQRVENVFENRCNRILTELRQSSGRYLSDVVSCGDSKGAKQFADYISRNTRFYKRGLILISQDKDHVHIVHDCSFSTETCRCGWFKQAEIMLGFRRRDRPSYTRPLCNSITAADIQNILFYYSNDERYTSYLKIGGSVERLPSEGAVMEKQGLEGRDGLADEVAPSEEDDTVSLFGEEWDNWRTLERARGRSKTVSGKEGKVGGSRSVLRKQKMNKLFEENPTSPADAILNHPIWLNHEDFQYLNFRDDIVKAVLHKYTHTLNHWSMKDFEEHYAKPNVNPIFAAGYGDILNTYYDVEESVDILDNLMQFQCDDDDEKVYEFIKTLYNVLERKVPKQNAICIYSKPSAGKNFFFDCIKDFFINVGAITTLTRNSSFGTMDSQGKRLVFFNEPNYHDEYLEYLKTMLGGDQTKVDVKYGHPQSVQRTPVIVLTNNLLTFMSDIAFVDRLKTFEWKPAPYLKDMLKKPHPLATPLLFRRYKLLD
uniref:NS1 n=1 Tax=uncultured densovirus TaxID=748192 RepID=A0A7L7YTX8_9VIRU|nr:NS1 [uncultured densovirus]